MTPPLEKPLTKLENFTILALMIFLLYMINIGIKPHPVDINKPGYIKQPVWELNGYIPKTNIVHSEIGAEK